jgi:hypothetical protein
VLARHRTWIAVLESLQADAGTLVPAVFPELLRRRPVRDEVENAALAALYVARGTSAADFSVGRFQMKPSFAERLETAVGGLPDPPPGIALICAWPPGEGEAARRRERFLRLCSEEWQLRYLAAMEHVLRARFALESMGREERIRFVAAAYNHGFWRGGDEIEGAADWRLFPGGGPDAPFRYADVAVDFWRRYWRALGFE